MPEATLARTEAPQPGQLVLVRQRLYLVEETVEPVSEGESTLVRMSCLDDDNQGQPLDVLWEVEIDKTILKGEDWHRICERGFDETKMFAAYLKTLRWNCVTATDPKLFQAPFRAGIKLDAYQLEPLRKALLLPRVNLLIADDVGLGKTIEAGLIVRELLLRKKVRDIVVACPPSMLYQWKDELESRFGLQFEIVDRDYMQRIRQDRGYSVNPWTTNSKYLISHRLLIDEHYAAPLRDWLSSFRPGTLLILDEAHHAAPASGQKYAIDSQITKAVRELARRFEHRLFLSATPHNGHSNSFSALLEILDPQRFLRGFPVNPKMLEDVVVRRLKEDVRAVVGGFPKRVVVQIDIDGLPLETPEIQLASLLDEYKELRESRFRNASPSERATANLLVVGLQQRLLSSIEAFAKTLKVHCRTVKKQLQQTTANTPNTSKLFEISSLDLVAGIVDSDDDRARLPEEQLEAEEQEQVIQASLNSVVPGDTQNDPLVQQEQQLLDKMTKMAEASRDQADAKVERLLQWIRTNQCPDLGKPDAQWTNKRVIIFTEYDDTKRYLMKMLHEAIGDSQQADERIAVYQGPTSTQKRERIKQAFNGDPDEYPVRILLATDAAREGLNLQTHCSNLFHFDVPWNPSRMEQRNGRIDRKLQSSEEVFCHYFVYAQRPEDRILRRLVEKAEVIRKELGSISEVIDSRLSTTLRNGITRSSLPELEYLIQNADLDSNHKEAIKQELESARKRQDELSTQIEHLSKRLDDARDAIGLRQDHLRSAISSALLMIGASELRALPADNSSSTPQFVFPAVDQRQGADPTWAETMDALRLSRNDDQKLFQWRKEAPIRPVVFEDPGKLDDKVVHLHLEHRVVQRLLNRFRSQGFVHHDLSRACIAQTADKNARVILLGRLGLYGDGAARLHEEIVPITARWIDFETRNSPLVPYSRDTESKTLELLDEGLLKNVSDQGIASTLIARLQASAPRDVSELLPHLQSRAEEAARVAIERLNARAEAEAKAMITLLKIQKEDIRKREGSSEVQQLSIFLDNELEKRQLAANKRFWAERSHSIDEELVTEPDRIRRLYSVKAQRIEPVGLIYLCPVNGAEHEV